MVKNPVLFKRTLVIGIIILFVGMSVNPSTGTIVERESNNPITNGNTLYVGGSGEGNYTSIQDAIDNASDEDNVFVYKGTYNENIIINKSINVVGEDKNSTIINGSYWGAVVYITADYVNFSNFKLQYPYYSSSGSSGIHLNSNYSIIRDNIIDFYYYDMWYLSGIYLDYSNYNVIIGNYISIRGYYWDAHTIGVNLYRSDNNIITRNIISNNTKYFSNYNYYSYGICVSDSKNNTIKDNIISKNEIGVEFYSSYNNNIRGNNIFNNSIHGISLYQSSKNNISYNNFSHNSLSGIEVYKSNKMKIFENSFINDGIFVDDSYLIINDNKVNGRPLVYLINESDHNIIDAGQIILINCSNITAENLNLSYTNVGVELWESNNCKITDNNCLNTYYGIYIRHSSNIMAQRNNLNSNTGYGLYSYNAHNIIVSNNSINGRSYGVSFWESEDNIINDNNISNNGYGIVISGSYFGSYSKNITITGNTICSNMYMDGGIRITNSKFINITSNNISNNDNGIYAADGASQIIIKDNVISNNSGSPSRGHGMLFWGAHDISVISNKINSNHGYGIHLFTGYNYNILNNSFSKNGLVVYESNNNNVENNSVNGKPLVYLENKSNHIITDAGQVVLVRCDNITVNNLNLSNASIGIHLLRTNYCKITNNNCSEGKIGIYFRKSNNNTLIGNMIISNVYDGIFFQLTSNNNNIFKNIITKNKGHGIHISHSNYIIIEDNSISKNDHSIYFYGTYNSKIFHNNFIDNEYNARATGNNTWDDGYPSGGNYWDDYTGEDVDGDGIGDIPYNISGSDNQDLYPLMTPYGPPHADFTCFVDDRNVTFNASRSYDYDGTIISYEWDFGDNDYGTGEAVEHTYSEYGSYDVSLTVIDNDCKIDTTTKTILIDTIPPEIIDNTNDTATTGDIFTFNATVTDNLEVVKATVNYRYGDGGIQNVDMVNTAGDYWEVNIIINDTLDLLSYTLYAIDTSGNEKCSESKNVTIYDNDPPEIIDNTNDTATTGDIFTFNATVTDNLEVVKATVNYRYGDGGIQNVDMVNTAGDYWEGSIIIEHTLELLYYSIYTEDTYGNGICSELWNITILDNDLPEISDLVADPNVQMAGSYVNISGVVIDNIDLSEVNLHVEFPDSTEEVYPIIDNKIGDTYYSNRTYIDDGTYEFYILAKDTSGNENVSETGTFDIVIGSPPEKPQINGPSEGKKDEPIEFEFKSIDGDGHDVYYYIDWGDGTFEDWFGPFPSGKWQTMSHTWAEKGEYTVKIKAKDITGLESGYSEHPITIPRFKEGVQKYQPSTYNQKTVVRLPKNH